MHWNCRILYTWLYITDSNSFNFNGIFLETSEVRTALMNPGRTKHVHNLRWRSIISKPEKSLINIYIYILLYITVYLLWDRRKVLVSHNYQRTWKSIIYNNSLLIVTVGEQSKLEIAEVHPNEFNGHLK